MEIVTSGYILTMFITILVVFAGVFGPQSIERDSPQLTEEQHSKMHCRIFGTCIFFGGIFLLGGLLDLVGTLATVIAGEVAFFGVMYFVGVLAHQSDKKRLAEERAREEARKAQAERVRIEALQRAREAAYRTLVEEFFALYLEQVTLSIEGLSTLLSGPIYDEEFLRDFEDNAVPRHRVWQWRLEVYVSAHLPSVESETTLQAVRNLAVRYVDKRIVEHAHAVHGT